MPLGLPPHLAARTTSTAVSRAGHAAAAVCLIGVGVIVLSIQAYLPQVVVWPALIIVILMIVLLWLLGRSPSVFIAVSYLAVGGLSVFWFTLIASHQLDTPVANDGFTITLFKIALIFVVGVGPHLGASMLWITGGFAIGELASILALLWLGDPWRIDVTTLTVWFIAIGLLAVLRADLVTSRYTQLELYRAARDEMLSDVRHTFESRAAALLHDTVLNQLAVMMTSRDLSAESRGAIHADLARIVGEEWFAVDADDVAPVNQRAERLRALIDEAAGGAVHVAVTLHDEVLDALDAEAFAEFSRAIAQCVANVRRHANTDSAEVVLGRTAAEVSAMVIDGGQGFSLDARAEGRLGVDTSIVGRLESIGGVAVVWSQPEKGTSVLLRVPVRELADEPGLS